MLLGMLAISTRWVRSLRSSALWTWGAKLAIFLSRFRASRQNKRYAVESCRHWLSTLTFPKQGWLLATAAPSKPLIASYSQRYIIKASSRCR